MATRKKPLVHSDPEILGGTPVFSGTRVPVDTLFDWLEHGYTLDRYLENFPSVKREQAVEALERACKSIQADALRLPAGPYPPI